MPILRAGSAHVLFAELAMACYTQGSAAERLHDEVIVPARRRGYREVWLSGASMGGMGALLYDRAYPGDADGLVLLDGRAGGACRGAARHAQRGRGHSPGCIAAVAFPRRWRARPRCGRRVPLTAPPRPPPS